MVDVPRRTCFVIGPIGANGSETRKSADFLLKGIIRPAIEASLQLKIWRADEDNSPGMITDKVIADIFQSDLVVSDLSELNPNAFYELGIRHAASKPTIHMATQGTKLPFDNLGYRAILFDKSDWDSIESSKQQLYAQAVAALDATHKVSNPVTQALSAAAFRASAEPQEQVTAELMLRVSSLEQQVKSEKQTYFTRPDANRSKHMREASDIFREVASIASIEVEEPYFYQAVDEILAKYPIGHIENLYERAEYNRLAEMLTAFYVPF